MSDNKRIGWIGIGRMGYAMAARLAKQGAAVRRSWAGKTGLSP